MPVNTSSCISCSTKWWNIKLPLFLHLHACFLLPSVAKEKEAATTAELGIVSALHHLEFVKLLETNLAWVHWTHRRPTFSPRSSCSSTSLVERDSDCLQLFFFPLSLFRGRFCWRIRCACCSYAPLVPSPLSDQTAWPYLDCGAVRSWCREPKEECSLLS